MPVSGLVLTLDADPNHARAALAALRADDCIDVGVPVGPRLPVVTDTPDAHADRRLQDRIRSICGVEYIDVVFVHFDAPAAEGSLS